MHLAAWLTEGSSEAFLSPDKKGKGWSLLLTWHTDAAYWATCASSGKKRASAARSYKTLKSIVNGIIIRKHCLGALTAWLTFCDIWLLYIHLCAHSFHIEERIVPMGQSVLVFCRSLRERHWRKKKRNKKEQNQCSWTDFSARLSLVCLQIYNTALFFIW